MNIDDILEDALNNGLEYSAKKHNISKEEVRKIVYDFKESIEDVCSCERARLKGEVQMCWMCDFYGNRIQI